MTSGKWIELTSTTQYYTHLIVAFLTPCIPLAQVGKSTGHNYLGTLLSTASIVIAIWASVYCIIHGAIAHVHYETLSASITLVVCMGIFSLTLLYLRCLVRDRDNISSTSGADDCCLSFYCSCCVLAQLSMHVQAGLDAENDFNAPKGCPHGKNFKLSNEFRACESQDKTDETAQPTPILTNYNGNLGSFDLV